MAGVNKVILIGRIGKTPETRFTQSGAAVCNFSVATSESWKDKQSGEKKETTEWHRIVTFGKLAEICGQYLQKGKQVYIGGRLQTRSWEQDGVTKYTTEIVANEMQMLDSKSDNQQSQGQPTQQSQQQNHYTPQGGNQPAGGFDDGSEIPF